MTMENTNNYNVSRYNATKHGLRSQDTVLPWESVDSFEELQNSLFEEYAPSTPTQRELVQQLTLIFWKQRRLYLAENALTKFEAARKFFPSYVGAEEIAPNPKYQIIYDAASGNIESERLIRYDAHLSRRLIRTLSLLHQLKVLEQSKVINN